VRQVCRTPRHSFPQLEGIATHCRAGDLSHQVRCRDRRVDLTGTMTDAVAVSTVAIPWRALVYVAAVVAASAAVDHLAELVAGVGDRRQQLDRLFAVLSVGENVRCGV
jgi:hypothetical protein